MILKPHLMSTFLFDAHNHIHMSIPGGIPPLVAESINQDYTSHPSSFVLINKNDVSENHAKSISEHFVQIYENMNHGLIFKEPPLYPIKGMALMSTQPRDFPFVSHLSTSLAGKFSWNMIPCFGIHPWFLHIANSDFPFTHDEARFAETMIESGDESALSHPTQRLQYLQHKFGWYNSLVQQLQLHPQSHVGEIGLDGARFTYSTDDPSDEPSREKILVSPMILQVEAMEIQFHLAADLHKSCSIHVVQAWGPLMELLKRVKRTRLETVFGSSPDKPKMNRKDRLQERKLKKEQGDESIKVEKYLWPPKIYFHSFGGKPAVIDQLDALLGRSTTLDNGENIPGSQLYFGFAPVINFRSPKTSEVIKKVGISRLVLETDLEDYTDLVHDLHRAVGFVAEALNIDPDTVVEQTFRNSKQLYNIL